MMALNSKPLQTSTTASVAALVATLVVSASHADTLTIQVSARANIFGSGHSGAEATPEFGGPTGATAPPFVPVSGLRELRIASVTGSVSFGGSSGPFFPDGIPALSEDFLPVNGVSGFVQGPAYGLYGVFNDGIEPTGPAPQSLDLSDTLFATISPAINQVFFIGDGRGANGILQTFFVPSAATKLFLGLADGTGPNNEQFGEGGFFRPGAYGNNSGFYTATVAGTAIPEPSGGVLILCASALASLRRRPAAVQPIQAICLSSVWRRKRTAAACSALAA